VAALVPFTFTVEELTAAQFLDLVAGRLGTWQDVGGPLLPVELGVRDRALAAAATGMPMTAQTVDDVEGWLGAARGRVVLAPLDGGGPLLKPLRVAGARPGESGYPVSGWTLAGREPDEHAPALASALSARAASRQEPEITIAAVGDIMLARGVGASIATRGQRYPFEAVAPLLAGADIRIGNLELPLTERGRAVNKDYVFRASPALAEALNLAGFNVLTVANNHSLDYGPDGLVDTLAALDQAGIARPGGGRSAAEAHAPALLSVNGLRVAVLGYVNTPNDGRSGWQAESMRADGSAPGVAWGTPDVIRRDVAAARSAADVVIVALHAGWEYTAAPNPVQRELAYAAVEAGAALVLGAHPHVLQGIEEYRGVPIVYSLGNFVFDVDDDDRRQPGLPSVLTGILRVRLTRDGVRGLEFLPAVIDAADGRPVPATGAAATRVYERLYGLTDALAPGPVSTSGARGALPRTR
jgi:poly-gamma-glutamate synthesis protein (capsule biosynthesis protein)